MRWIWNIGVVVVSSAMAELSESEVGRRRGGRREGGRRRRAGRAIIACRRAAARGRRARSSAIRSSQPPTWVSPMKICGTVQRPVSLIIACALRRVARRPGSRRSSRRRAACSSALARRQYGQVAVLYILTGCIASAAQAVFSIGRLAARQAARPPARARRVLEAELLQHGDGARRARAGRADDDERQRLVLRQLARGFEAGQRHAARADRMAGRVLGRLADVDQHRLLAVDQAAPHRPR